MLRHVGENASELQEYWSLPSGEVCFLRYGKRLRSSAVPGCGSPRNSLRIFAAWRGKTPDDLLGRKGEIVCLRSNGFVVGDLSAFGNLGGSPVHARARGAVQYRVIQMRKGNTET